MVESYDIKWPSRWTFDFSILVRYSICHQWNLGSFPYNLPLDQSLLRLRKWNHPIFFGLGMAKDTY